MKRVTGIGGIFFKCKDPKALKEWYKTHLGIDVNEYGATFDWKEVSDSNPKGFFDMEPVSGNNKIFRAVDKRIYD
ncbi:hypothetical protein J3D55_000532 [Chryseobacterium ginsenosidimutans]|nr:hypothetical protein [Chryseobacterium ginsenosidimutans]